MEQKPLTNTHKLVVGIIFISLLAALYAQPVADLFASPSTELGSKQSIPIR